MNVLQKKDYFIQHENIAIMRCNNNKGHNISDHSHDFYEVVFIHQGSGIHTINNQKYTMLSGDVYLMSPNDHHQFTSDNDLSLTNLLFSKELFNQEDWLALQSLPGLSIFSSKSKGPYKIALSMYHKDQIDQQLTFIQNELKKDESGKELNIKALLMTILVTINRVFLAYGDVPSLKKVKNQPMREILRYLMQNYQKNDSIEFLANKAHVSPSYFSELFKKETGMTLKQFIAKIRVDKARKLIEDNELNISEIGYQVGFDDHNYFSRVFKKHCGISPTEYKNLS